MACAVQRIYNYDIHRVSETSIMTNNQMAISFLPHERGMPFYKNRDLRKTQFQFS